jgi:hypothetical protein
LNRMLYEGEKKPTKELVFCYQSSQLVSWLRE